ncbi:MAG: hypothetical protein EOO20_23050, partial [Chryseobacterium sp.]
MKKIINTIIVALLVLVVVPGCKKSEFEGTDNLIASFSLTQGATVMNASIKPDSILITAPGSISLIGAELSFKLSEKAKISPDPSAITDWELPHTFTVSAANGSKVVYHYRLKRNIISRDGDITLKTQEDVDRFAELKIDRINGSLVIGSTSGTDTIRTLDKLQGLTSIAYDLIINPTYKAKDLNGLKNLNSVGTLSIAGNPHLKTLILPKLELILADLLIAQTEVKSISFPQLKRVDQSFQVLNCDSVETLELPKLQNVLLNLTLQGSFASNNQQTAASFPALQNVGGIVTFLRYDQLATIEFPLLTKTSGIAMNTLPMLTSLKMPQLKKVNGDVNLGG